MDLSQYWQGGDQLDRIMPVLADLNAEGVVDSAGDWPTLRTELLSKLEQNCSDGDELIKPLDDAVEGGGEFKSLVVEMTQEYQAPPREQTAPPLPAEDDDQRLAAQFAAALPDPEELATRIVLDVGAVIGQLIAADPELAKIGDDELIRWVDEDVSATIDEIGKYGWRRLA